MTEQKRKGNKTVDDIASRVRDLLQDLDRLLNPPPQPKPVRVPVPVPVRRPDRRDLYNPR